MKKSNQKVVILHGSFNSGKTIVYNLFKKENNYKWIDISPDHLKDNKDEIEYQIGKKWLNKITPDIESLEIFKGNYFLNLFNLLLKEFPNYNFVVKPGGFDWVLNNKLPPNIFYNIFIIRHPKICWMVNTTHFSIDEFIKMYKKILIGVFKEKSNVIKIEEIGKNKLMNQLIKRTDLKQIKPITKFDEFLLKKINLETINDELEQIDDKLKDLIKYLEYDLDTIDINLILKRNT